MTSLGKMKVHEQSGTFRATIPITWARQNDVRSKDSLDVVVSDAIVILPKRDLTEKEVDEMVRDIKVSMKARPMLRGIE
jgi:hypothetical protein